MILEGGVDLLGDPLLASGLTSISPEGNLGSFPSHRLVMHLRPHLGFICGEESSKSVWFWRVPPGDRSPAAET